MGGGQRRLNIWTRQQLAFSGHKPGSRPPRTCTPWRNTSSSYRRAPSFVLSSTRAHGAPNAHKWGTSVTRTTTQFRWHPIMYVRRRIRPKSCSIAHTALVSTRVVRPVTPFDSGLPYRCVKLNAFLLAGILHLSHTQFARVVRHDFARPFLGLRLRRFRLEP